MRVDAITTANAVRARRRKQYAVVRGTRGWGQILALFTVKRDAERFSRRAALAPYVQGVSVWTLTDVKPTAKGYLNLNTHVSSSERIGFTSRLRVTKGK